MQFQGINFFVSLYGFKYSCFVFRCLWDLNTRVWAVGYDFRNSMRNLEDSKVQRKNKNISVSTKALIFIKLQADIPWDINSFIYLFIHSFNNYYWIPAICQTIGEQTQGRSILHIINRNWRNRREHRWRTGNLWATEDEFYKY